MDKNMNCGTNSGIGGQAVLEGIMMRNRGRYAIAVRRPDGGIEVREDAYKSVIDIPALQKIPILRGVVNFVDSLVVGIRCLTYSASFFEDEEDLPGDGKEKTGRATERAAEKTEPTEAKLAKKEKQEKLLMGGTVALSVVLAVLLFMALPLFLSRLIGRSLGSPLARSVLEAGIRVAVFLGYMIAISRMKDIQRTFAYHGAEHKCINCIESVHELTVENVMKSSRLHKRCGTSFLFFVIFVSVIFQMFIFAESRLAALGIRLLLIPVIAGISYEIIRLAGSSNHPAIALLSKPGLALQKLTTREPDESQAEVAIRAVEAVFDWHAFLQGKRGEETVIGSHGTAAEVRHE